MSGVSRMNGQTLRFESFMDYGKPTERRSVGKHISVETAAKMFRRFRLDLDYGWCWVEPFSDVGFTLQEIILKHHRPWDEARVRAFVEWKYKGPNPILSRADCCVTAGAWLNEHQRTTRHFRYWCLEMRPRALGNWPWLREVMAEEVLST